MGRRTKHTVIETPTPGAPRFRLRFTLDALVVTKAEASAIEQLISRSCSVVSMCTGVPIVGHTDLYTRPGDDGREEGEDGPVTVEQRDVNAN